MLSVQTLRSSGRNEGLEGGEMSKRLKRASASSEGWVNMRKVRRNVLEKVGSMVLSCSVMRSMRHLSVPPVTCPSPLNEISRAS